MKYISCFRSIVLFGTLLLSSGGCTHIADPETGPLPMGDPYKIPAAEKPSAESISLREERLINEIVSAISLQMALSPAGPCRILCRKKPSVLAEKIFLSLASMGLIRNDGKQSLYLTEEDQKTAIRFRLTESGSGKIFFEYHIPKQENNR